MDTYNECFQEAADFVIRGEHQKALDLFDLLLSKQHDDPQVLYSVGTLYSQVGRYGLSIPYLIRAIERMPEHAEAINNLAISFRQVGKPELAKRCYERSLELNYGPSTLSNFSGFYVNAGNPDECIRLANLVLELAPDHAQALTHKGLALMEKGEWAEGFKFYDARCRLPGYERREYGVRRWDGGETDLLAIHGEQGVGDEIMFMSCFPEIAKRVKRVVVECTPRLVDLFRASFGVTCYGTHAELLAHENPTAWIPMGSLAQFTGFVKRAPYIHPAFTVPRSERFRLGISFRGGTRQTHEYLRNFPLEQWRPLTNLDAEIYSVQHGPAAGHAQRLGLIHNQEWIDDLDKLCGLIKSCDLVVSVCGTAVHMAGAMGVPCFVLVPSKPAWRYGIKGDSMPWYDSVRLFRQGDGEPWANVVQRVREAVVAYHERISGTQQKVA